MTPGPSGDLLARLAEVARAVDTGSVQQTLQETVDAAVGIVPGCQHAGITVARARTIVAPVATDEIALRFDAMQVELGEGPCIDAISDARVFRCDDLASEPRWPAFSATAASDLGISSVLALRLFARQRVLGALNLLSAERSAFTDDSQMIAALFAAIAAVALHAAEAEEGLQTAVRSRDVIGRAKGILMERHKITDDEAFQRLADVSQRTNVRLVTIAEHVAETGEEGGVSPG